MLDLVILFVIHFISDFLLQSREIGEKKSKEIKYLCIHFYIIFVSFTLLNIFIFDFYNNILFALIYGFIHCLQDWYVWRLYKWIIKMKTNDIENYQYWKDSKFYSTIGFDQLLHFIEIILIYNWIK